MSYIILRASVNLDKPSLEGRVAADYGRCK